MSIETDFSIEERVQVARKYFLSGYNCAQSVFMAYASLLAIDEEKASCLSVSFGGGLGRMREVCGTVSAMFMINGFKYAVTDSGDLHQRKVNYAKVQLLAKRFKEQHGSIICRELLSTLQDIKTNPEPSPRTEEYYAKRPCVRFVTSAARIIGELLQEE